MGICDSHTLEMLKLQVAKETLEYQIENEIPENKKHEDRRWKIDYIIAINKLNSDDRFFTGHDYTNLS